MCRVTITTFSNPWCQSFLSWPHSWSQNPNTLCLNSDCISPSPYPPSPLRPISVDCVQGLLRSLWLCHQRGCVARWHKQWSCHSLSNLYWVLINHRKQICTWTDSPRSVLEPAVVKGYKRSVPRWIRSGDLMVAIVNNTILTLPYYRINLKFVESRS